MNALVEQLFGINLFEMSLEDLQREIMHLSTLSNERESVLFFKNGSLIDRERRDMSYGTHKRVKVDIKGIAQLAREKGADEIFSIHNHPTGQLMPSYNDIKTAGLMQQELGLIKLRSFIVSGENYGAQGTNFVKPSWIEYDTRGQIIDKYMSQESKEKGIGIRIRVPRGTMALGKKRRGRTLSEFEADAIKQTSHEGAVYYGYLLGKQTFWSKAEDVEVLEESYV